MEIGKTKEKISLYDDDENIKIEEPEDEINLNKRIDKKQIEKNQIKFNEIIQKVNMQQDESEKMINEAEKNLGLRL
jgi:hypothetical protein